MLKSQLIILEDISKENENLKEKIEDLNKIICKFTLGKMNFEKMMGTQRFGLQKVGLGYKSSKNNKYYKNYFVKAMSSYDANITCFHCNHKGHFQFSCPIKSKMNVGMKKVWVSKGTQVQYALSFNPLGPKLIWVPKSQT